MKDLGFINLLFNFVGLLGALVPVLIGLALVFFLWGMAIFILNSGNEEKRKEGKQKMFWGIIALTVMVGIWGIVNLILLSFPINSGTITYPDFPTELP